MKEIWVGRLDENDGHVVPTPHGTVSGRSVRRLVGSLRVHVGGMKTFRVSSLSSAAEQRRFAMSFV